MTDPVYACLAAMPAREDALREVIASLVAQVDGIFVTLDGWERAPALPSKVTACVQKDLGDAGKFFWTTHRIVPSGYVLHCDDDLLYPPDYAASMVDAIEARSRRAAVSHHGVRLKRWPITSYARDREVRPCLRTVRGDRAEHILGTGVLGYHSSLAASLSMRHFQNGKMADVWFGLWAQAARVPLVSLPHRESWLQLLVSPREDSLWNRMKRDGDRDQVAAINRRPWRLHEDDPEAHGACSSCPSTRPRTA